MLFFVGQGMLEKGVIFGPVILVGWFLGVVVLNTLVFTRLIRFRVRNEPAGSLKSPLRIG